MSSYRIQVKEVSVAAAQLYTGSGRVCYAIESEKGLYNSYIYCASETDLLNYLGAPTTNRLSQQFHVIKNILQYQNDVVLQRALDLDTAKQERIGISFSETGYAISLDQANDVKFIPDFELHSIQSNIAQHATLQMEFYAKEAYDAERLSIAICKPDYTQTGISVWGNITDTADGSTRFVDYIDGEPRLANEEIAVCVLVSGVPVEWFIVSLKDGNKSVNNENNYIADYLLAKSAYVVGYAKDGIFSSVVSFKSIAFEDGDKGDQPSDGDFETAYSKFRETDDISFDYRWYE